MRFHVSKALGGLGLIGIARDIDSDQHYCRLLKIDVDGYYRAVANGPVGPAMAGPIIEPAIFFFS